VQYFGWFANLPSIFLAMEYMPLGNLAKHFGKSGCSEKEAATVTYQLLRALKFMHDRGFVHRNLKPTVSPNSLKWSISQFSLDHC